MDSQDKQKLRECWERIAQGPCASTVVGEFKTVKEIYKVKLNRPELAEAIFLKHEERIQDGDFKDVDELIAYFDWLYSDPAKLQTDYEVLRKGWIDFKTQVEQARTRVLKI